MKILAISNSSNLDLNSIPKVLNQIAKSNDVYIDKNIHPDAKPKRRRKKDKNKFILENYSEIYSSYDAIIILNH